MNIPARTIGDNFSLFDKLKSKLQEAPPFLILLSFVEMWERFSYYGLRTLLVIFMVSELGFSDPRAYAVYSVFAALSYAGPVLGGLIADRLTGFKYLIALGGIINAVGHACLAFTPLSQNAFFIGLGFVAVGTGFFKGNISNLLGQFYEPNDPRRDAGFTSFYVAVNVGAFLASITCGAVAHAFGWHYGFALAGVGMLAGLFALFRFAHIIADKGNAPVQLKKVLGGLMHVKTLLVLCTIVLACFSAFILDACENSEPFFYAIAAVVAAFMFKELLKASPQERRNLIVLIVFAFFNMTFFALEMQLGSLIALFTERNVDSTFFGVTIPSTVSQAINPLVIILLGSVVSSFWTSSKTPGRRARFGAGLLLMALAFVFLLIGCIQASSHGLVDYTYMALAQAAMSVGELCLAPLILAFTTVLAPVRLRGFVMGTIMLSISFANLAGIAIGKVMAVPTSPTAEVDPLVSLPIYREGFFKILVFTLALFALYTLVSRFLKPSSNINH